VGGEATDVVAGTAARQEVLRRVDLPLKIALLVVTAAGIGFSAALALERELWFDEILSIQNAVETSYSGLVLHYRSQDANHPPLSFVLMKLSIDVAHGDDPWVVRLVPLLAGIACVPVAYLVGRQCHSGLLGLCAAAATACDRTLVDLNSQARMFSLACLFTLLSLLGTTALVRGRLRNWKHAVGLGLVLGVSLWNSQLALASWGMAAVTIGVVMAADLYAGRGSFRAQLLNALAVAAVAALVGLPGLRDLMTARLQQGPALGGPRFATVVEDMRVTLPVALPYSYRWLGLAVAVVGLLWLLRRQGLVVVPLIALLGLSLLQTYAIRQRLPYLTARYLVPLLPCLVFGLAAYVVLPRWAVGRLVAFLAFGLAVLVPNLFADGARLIAWRSEYEWQIEPFVRSLRPDVRPGDRVFFSPPNTGAFGHHAHFPVADGLAEVISGGQSPGARDAGSTPERGCGTWLVAARLIAPVDAERAKAEAVALADLYKQELDRDWLEKSMRAGQSAALRISPDGVSYYARAAEPSVTREAP
jgi:hypothetical protein